MVNIVTDVERKQCVIIVKVVVSWKGSVDGQVIGETSR